MAEGMIDHASAQRERCIICASVSSAARRWLDAKASYADAGFATYVLSVPVDARRTLAAAWLILGLFAICAAGILSILLVASRTPGLQSVFPGADFLELFSNLFCRIRHNSIFFSNASRTA